MKTETAILLLTAISLFSCNMETKRTGENQVEQNIAPAPKHFVFIPGSFHGAWCWNKMQPLLSSNGNTSEAIDLPAHGADSTSIGEVTLDSYVNAVIKSLEKYSEPVVLIGHSRAGIVISQVAERAPEKIQQLVYLCAFLIPNGEPMVATALMDSASLLATNLIFNETEGWHFPKDSVIQEAFYNDCSAEDIARAVPLLTKEPNTPVGTPLQLSDARYGTVKKAYIYTTQDNTITFELQQQMVKRIPVDTTFELNAGHSPFLSQPEKLADILLNL